MTAGYALASGVDKKLAPFMLSKGIAETEVASRLFSNFRELYGIFSRMTMENSMRAQLRAKNKRHDVRLEVGAVVAERFETAEAPAT